MLQEAPLRLSVSHALGTHALNTIPGQQTSEAGEGRHQQAAFLCRGGPAGKWPEDEDQAVLFGFEATGMRA